MTWIEILSAVLGSTALGGGGTWGARHLSRRRSEAAHSKRERQLIEKLTQVQAELERRRERCADCARPGDADSRRGDARAAGFAPGDTGSFERANSMGSLRCDGHAAIAQASEDTRAAVQAAASAAALASAASMRLEETVRRESEATREAIDRLGEKFEALSEWKGSINAHREHIDGQVRALWAEARELRGAR